MHLYENGVRLEFAFWGRHPMPETLGNRHITFEAPLFSPFMNRYLQPFEAAKRLTTVLIVGSVKRQRLPDRCFPMWRRTMYAAIDELEHESLFGELVTVLSQWPELDRTVFSQAHYNGKSPESISRSLHLDVKEVSTILRQCESRLHASLRDFRIHGVRPDNVH
jgi:DNA-directed RNA polymerase specialized sigma24 family protein